MKSPEKSSSPTKKEPPITDYKSFWDWFIKHERKFYKLLKRDGSTNGEFIEAFEGALWQLNKQYYCGITEHLRGKRKITVCSTGGDWRKSYFWKI